MSTNYNLQAVADFAVSNLGAKPNRAARAASEYQNAIFKEIQYGYYVLATMEQIKKNQIPFSLNRVRHALGRYGTGGKSYWWDWLHKNFPLVNIVKVGNSKQGLNSVIEPQIPIEIILASGNAKDLVEALYSRHDPNSEIHFAPINTYSLQSYILSTSSLRNTHEVIQKNLQDAKLILTVANECNGQLPMIVSESKFGRTYYKGLNLQSVHKTVRHAALGSCYSVDIDSAVFNWKYSVVPFNQQLSYTRELIKDKDRIRKSLAQLVFSNTRADSIKTIKKVLTAISFGAKTNSRGYYLNPSWTSSNDEPRFITSSIDTMIKSPDLKKKLFNDPWMKEFMKEQDQINTFISTFLKDCIKNKEIQEDKIEDIRNESGRISDSKLIAWAYQQTEQQVMNEILKYSRTEVLLQVHDGVYFKTKPDMPSMQTILQDHWPLATLSIEQIDNYHYKNREMDTEHKELIRREEIKANNGACPARTGIHNESVAVKRYDPHVEPNWESDMMAEHNQLFAPKYNSDIQAIIDRSKNNA